jgi:hypothetical protein
MVAYIEGGTYRLEGGGIENRVLSEIFRSERDEVTGE